MSEPSKDPKKIPDYAKHLGPQLRQAMLTRGVKQKAFADIPGLPQSSISNVLNGKQGMKVETLIAVANTIDASLDYLLRGALTTGAARAAQTIDGAAMSVLASTVAPRRDEAESGDQEDDRSIDAYLRHHPAPAAVAQSMHASLHRDGESLAQRSDADWAEFRGDIEDELAGVSANPPRSPRRKKSSRSPRKS